VHLNQRLSKPDTHQGQDNALTYHNQYPFAQ
jgi:hypothetical protein